MTRLALVESPDAGRGDTGCVGRLLEGGVEVESFHRARVGEIPAAGFDRIVVAGGDGSVGPAAEAAARAGVPLAVIPTGTANNFAAAVGLPTEVGEACSLAARGERTRSMELGFAGTVPFVNLASAGLAPVAARRAKRLKRALGPTAYAVGAAAAAASTPPLPCEVEAAGRDVFSGRVWQVMVASSGAFGPGVRVEGTDPGDGALDFVAVPAGPRFDLLRRGWWIMRGRIASQPGAVYARADEFEVDVPDGTEFNIDGEVVALGPARFSIERDAFELVVP